MLQAGWLIIHLLVGMLTGPQAAAATPPPGVSCTYQACMTKCDRLSGLACNSYCEAKVAQRVAARICLATQPADEEEVAARAAD